MSKVVRSLAPTLALAMVLAACGGGGELEDPGERSEATVLEVENQSALDMSIYVVRQSGSRVRLGTATAHLTSRFTIPESLVFGITSLRFQADPVGSGRAPVSRDIAVSAGQTVVLTIPPF